MIKCPQEEVKKSGILEMGKNGREYVVKNHGWVSVTKRVAEVCESAIREHKNKRK